MSNLPSAASPLVLWGSFFFTGAPPVLRKLPVIHIKLFHIKSIRRLRKWFWKIFFFFFSQTLILLLPFAQTRINLYAGRPGSEPLTIDLYLGIFFSSRNLCIRLFTHPFQFSTFYNVQRVLYESLLLWCLGTPSGKRGTPTTARILFRTIGNTEKQKKYKSYFGRNRAVRWTI